MWVVVYNPASNEEYMRRELEGEELLNARIYAEQVGNTYGMEIEKSNGYIPNCSGDIRVEFREDPDNSLIIWSGESFYFKHE